MLLLRIHRTTRMNESMEHLPQPVDGWWLYVLLCVNGRLYVGIARDVDARFIAHRAGKGAMFTRINAPERILARAWQPTQSAALRAEHALKKLTREQKLAWVALQGAVTDAG
jgi:putative endonuclease